MVFELIDLSTPQRPAKDNSQLCLSSDFTPALSLALSQTFNKSTAKRSNLSGIFWPNNSSIGSRTLDKIVETDRDDSINSIANNDLDFITGSLDISDSSNIIPTPPTVQLSSRLAELREVISPDSACRVQFGGLMAPCKESSSPSKHSTAIVTLRAVENRGVKRSPSTPTTPGPLKRSHQRRRILGDVSNNESDSNRIFMTPIGKYQTPKPCVNPWGIDFSPYRITEVSGDETEETDNDTSTGTPLHTPASVQKMRKMVQNLPRRGGKQRFAPLRSQEFQNYPQTITQNFSPISLEIQPSTPFATENSELLEADYRAWLFQRKSNRLQTLVQFMELERKLGI